MHVCRNTMPASARCQKMRASRPGCQTCCLTFCSLQVARLVTGGSRPETPEDRSLLPGPATSFEGLETYVDLMRRCWAQSPADRPSFTEVIVVLR